MSPRLEEMIHKISTFFILSKDMFKKKNLVDYLLVFCIELLKDKSKSKHTKVHE